MIANYIQYYNIYRKMKVLNYLSPLEYKNKYYRKKLIFLFLTLH
ncbi:IS3 family transposase [Candidatus Phytoplasma solani]